jgi:hypothetical protein
MNGLASFTSTGSGANGNITLDVMEQFPDPGLSSATVGCFSDRSSGKRTDGRDIADNVAWIMGV